MKWFDIKNLDNGTAEISIFDEIGIFGIDATQFKNELDSVKNAKAIKLLLNSPGGSVFDGVSIYNMLKDYREKLTVEVTGLAASIASVIAMAGKEIVMREGTMLMIHKPWSIAMGDADEMRKTADLLDQIESQITTIYANRTELSRGVIQQMLKEETWMTADDAVEYGFATAKDEAPKMAASYVGELRAKKKPEGLHLVKEEIEEKELIVAKQNEKETNEKISKWKQLYTNYI